MPATHATRAHARKQKERALKVRQNFSRREGGWRHFLGSRAERGCTGNGKERATEPKETKRGGGPTQ